MKKKRFKFQGKYLKKNILVLNVFLTNCSWFKN